MKVLSYLLLIFLSWSALGQTGFVEFTNEEFFAYENDEELVVTVHRLEGSLGPARVVVETFGVDIGASEDDFEEGFFEVVFEDGEDGIKELVIPIFDDDDGEGDETFGLILTPADDETSIGDLNFATGVILDDDVDTETQGVLSFWDDQFGGLEGDGYIVVEVIRNGAEDLRLEAELSTFSLNRDLGVDPAIENEDYEKTCVPVVLEPGVEIEMVIVPIIDDTEPERVEFFGVGLHSPSENTIIGTPDLAAMGIIDDDGLSGSNGAMRLSAAEYRVTEGETLLVTVERAGNSEGTLSGYLEIFEAEESAIEGEDYQEEVEFEIMFGPGDTTPKQFEISILNDDIPEGVEVFAIGINPDEEDGAIAQPFQALVTIDDDDAERGLPVLDQEEYYVDESAGIVTITIYREGSTEGRLDFWFGTADLESATAGEDFEQVVRRLSFPPGSSDPLTVEVPIIDDELLELSDDNPWEIFFVGLAWSNDFEDVIEFAPVVILENDLPDSPGYVVPETDWYAVAESEGSLEVSVQRVFGKQGRLETVLRTQPGTALENQDFEPLEVPIVFEDGEVGKKNFTVTITNDDVAEEAPEYFSLVIPNGDEEFKTEIVIVDDDVINTKIISPVHESSLPKGSVTLEAMVEGQENQDQYTFDWEICSSSGDDCRFKTGRKLEETFNKSGIYVVACYAMLEGQAYDVTPDVIGFRIESDGEVSATITKPKAKERRVAVGKNLAFVGEATPADAQVSWYFLADPDVRFDGNLARRTFNTPGEYALIFEAVDPATGESDSDYVVIKVGAESVGLQIESPADGSKIRRGETVQFRGQLTGPRQKRMEAKVAWTISDGTRLTGLSPRYQFNEAGVYEVRLIGEAPNGGRFEDSIVLFVEDPGNASIVDFNFPTDLNIRPGQDVFFQARVLENRGYKLSDLAFEWQLAGKKSNLATPGKIKFSEPGVYKVSLSARVRATGLRSDTVTRTITVAETADSSFEPNDDFSQASSITPGDYANLTLDENSNIDIYKVTVLSQDQRLVLELNPTQPMIAELLDANQGLLNSRTIEGPQNLQLNGLAPGDYFVRLTPVSLDSLKRMGSLNYELNIGVLNPALYYPDIRVDALFTTDLGVVNPSGDKASLQITGYNTTGDIVANSNVELPARGRLHQSVEQLFGAVADQVAWIQIDATRDLVGYARTSSRDAKEVYGISATSQLRSELFVPHIAQQTQQWFTRSSVINGSQKTSVAEIRASGQVMPLDVSAGFSSDRFDYLQKFGGTLPADVEWATLKEATEQPNLAGTEIFGMLDKNTRQIAGLKLADVRQDNPNFTYISNNLYFTHIARNVEQFWTGIALVNIGQVDQSVNIRAFGADGVEIGSATATLSPGEKRVQLADEFLTGIGSPANVDWVLVEADQAIVGYELFGTLDFKKIAGLEAISGLRKQICYPFIDVDKDVAHGIAVVNVNPQPQNVAFTLYSNDGSALATINRQLAANEKLSITIEELFQDVTLETGQVPGWLECVAEAPLAGFELFLNVVNNEQMGALIAQ